MAFYLKSTFKVFLFLLVIVLPAQAQNLTLSQLMTLLSGQSSFDVRFKEEKIDAYLEIPIYLTGRVSFSPPDYLKKIIETPSRQWFELNGDTVTISIGGKELRVFSAQEHPEIIAFFESFRSVLTGDIVSLKKFYTIKFSGDINKWELELKPHNKKLSYRLNSMIFSGHQSQLLQVTTLMQNGDSSMMTFIQ